MLTQQIRYNFSELNSWQRKLGFDAQADSVIQMNATTQVMIFLWAAACFILLEIAILTAYRLITPIWQLKLLIERIIVCESRQKTVISQADELRTSVNQLNIVARQQRSLMLTEHNYTESRGSDRSQSTRLQASPVVQLEESLKIPIYDESGKIAFAIANFANITECDRAEQLLAEYNRLLETQINKRTQELRLIVEQLRTTQKAADAANSAKSEFLANMSHELRTPLNAILGFTQIMSQDKTLSAENQQNLSIINRAGEHLLNLINDILEMSKIEAGKTTLNINNFDLMSLLDNLEEMLLNRATAKGLQLQFIYAANLPQHIQTDENKLRQVLLNIIGNAIKFTETGTVTLRVSLEKRGQGENTYIDSFPPSPHLPLPLSPPSPSSLLFEIQDTGIGIFPAELDFLFDAFAQTESGRKSQQGTGLGLAISRKYVELMGGVISVSSTVGVGSTFRFSLPVGLVAAADVSVASHPLAVIGLAPHQAQYRILVVDDVADSRLLLVKLLSSVGFFVLEATNGDEAVALWQHWHPQLIFMDMRMPVMDGYAATRLIRSLEVDSHLHTVADTPIFPSVHTFIIAVTAHAFAEQRQDILLAGCDDLIYKPFLQEVLLTKIKQYLDVTYVIQDEANTDIDVSSPTQTLLSETDVLLCISQMSNDWRKNIHYAAASCSDELILELIKQMPPENNPISRFFQDLANNYQFEKIMALTTTNPE
ncbi:ATP-binding protein [Nostoc sp. TCL26-01]|uniref:ATP-binding protein n=1 Tax=Nostoc sp. TCL26-01 TaxID=2576904 RepID=UPI002117DF74|nr:ATP-binding protein [Nostoc sp. TCL26-01]